MLAKGHWEYAERAKASCGVVIVAVTPENKLLLTEQFRVPVIANVIELPAGLAGDTEKFQGEEFEAAARRELMEETGYEADSWQQVTSMGPPSAGMSNEMVVFFRASGLRKVGNGGGEESENITVHEVHLENVAKWLESKRKEGALIDPKVFCGLYFCRT
ncbi:MAG: NUDIX hydrolase [Verrucomicrobiales bacterium]